jgi:hypothetical protein
VLPLSNFARLAPLLFLVSWPLPGQKWSVSFFHDEVESSLSLHEIVFPSRETGIALGVLERGRGRLQAVQLRTVDSGGTWRIENLKDTGISLFFLDGRLGWMVGAEGIWKTLDGGVAWRRIARRKGLLRVYFLDEQRGWAVGAEKQVLKTTDGGESWEKVPEAAEPQADAERTTYNWITFASPSFGIIVGNHSPDRDGSSRLPPWMEPERVRERRELPSTTISLQTVDGGKTWKPSMASLFGRMTRVRLLPGGRGLAIVEFTGRFEYPSEVYRLELSEGKSTRIFRRSDRRVTDALLFHDGSAILAAVEPQGTLQTLPIPGRLHVLRSDDLENWTEMDVDYRAVARRAVMCRSPGGKLWIATSEGMILRWEGGSPR